MGFCNKDESDEFFRSVPEFERMLIRSGIMLIKYWFSITDEEQQFRFIDANSRPAQAVEAQPDGCRVKEPVGALHQGEGGDAREDPYLGSARTRRSFCRRACIIPTITAARFRRKCTFPPAIDGGGAHTLAHASHALPRSIVARLK
jgi:hypothetical protein